MFAKIIVLLAVAIALASASSYDGRIVGGTDANIEDYPFMLSLRYMLSHTCGASILNAKTAITAQHCVRNRLTTLFSVRAGSANRLSGGNVHAVSTIIKHPDFNTENDDYDVAIVKVVLSFDSGLTAIGLPDHLAVLPGGTDAVIAGWGLTSFEGTSLTTNLQRANVPVVDRDLCYVWSGNFSGITERQICAGKENYDACNGDSGGPLIQGGKIWGIVSLGFECARFERPTIFASTAYHRLWIDQYL